MDYQHNNKFAASASSLFDSQPQHVKDILKDLHKGSITPFDQSAEPTLHQKPNMAQWHYHEELPTSLEKSNLDEYSSTGTSADSMYGSKTSGDSMYGSKTSGGSMYGNTTYSQPDLRNAPFEDRGREHRDQGYKESSNEIGWTPPGQKYYDGASFQGRDREMDDQRYYDDSMLGRGSGMSGQGYDDSNVRGMRQGSMGQPTNGNTGGRGRGGRGRGRGGDAALGRGSAKRGMLHGGGGYGPAAKKPKWQQGETGSHEQTFGAEQRWGGGGSGSRDSDNSARERGRGSRGRGFDGNLWGRGRGTGGQGSVSSTQGRGRGTMGRGRGGDIARGRGSAKRGMLQGGSGFEPAANKPKWQKEQQGKTGSSEQRWGAEQGWGRERIWGRGRGKDQGVRGRGSRGRQGGPPQRNNPGRSNQEVNDGAVEYGFDGKPVGPERLASTLGDFKYCKVCDIHINSMKSAKAHYSGKIHLKRLNSILQKEELMKTLDVTTDNCEVCNVVYTSPLQVKSHLDGNRHKKNVEEAKAKAEGRPIPSESTNQKKGEVDKETVADASREKASSGPSDERLMLERNEKFVEPKMKDSGEMPRPDSQSHTQSRVAPKTFPEGAPHTPNDREEQKNVQSQKGKGMLQLLQESQRKGRLLLLEESQEKDAKTASIVTFVALAQHLLISLQIISLAESTSTQCYLLRRKRVRPLLLMEVCFRASYAAFQLTTLTISTCI
ncbi:uncharacterized protein LOC115923207 [Strongylocentrotus purpuratus]|uniref:U1-type domain-containing protein n=1 Tax=Strongylocentrotus purpuratus TaxID=7668 RepID=A0A7M7NR89_STRPU|nr:uncharacterized protein LOC115923207 [Strongylocentrotus purpuratus]